VNCPRCGAWSLVKVKYDKADNTVRRDRVCGNDHRFTTLEMNTAAVLPRRVKAVDKTIANRVAIWRRDAYLSKNLAVGWKVLAEQFGLSKSGVFMAAKRGKQNARISD